MPKNSIEKILFYIGASKEDCSDIPEKVIESYHNLFCGYKKNYKDVIGSKFEKNKQNDIILFEEIDFFSTCKHHMIPFFGKIQIAYIPNKNIIGFSRINELVFLITRKLQLQEDIAYEIANEIQNSNLEPYGVFVQINGTHFCNLAKEKTSKPVKMKNFITTGEFKKQDILNRLQLILKF